MDFLWDSKPSLLAELIGGSIFLLIGSALVVVGLIGENRKSSLEFVAKWHPRFVTMVILGVAIELLADGFVFFSSYQLDNLAEQKLSALQGISNAQQSEIISLLPRELGATSRAEFASCKKLIGAPVLIQSIYADSEGYRLGSEILDALLKADIIISDKRGQAGLDLTKPPPFGLYVVGPKSEAPFMECLAHAIRETKELSDAVSKQISDEYPLSVYVGLKPVD
jgi:hypothetical protein